MGESIALKIIVKFKRWRSFGIAARQNPEGCTEYWELDGIFNQTEHSESDWIFNIITLQLPSSYEEIKGALYSDYGFKYTQEANWSWAGSGKVNYN